MASLESPAGAVYETSFLYSETILSMLIAVEPESSYGDFFGGRGKKVHSG